MTKHLIKPRYNTLDMTVLIIALNCPTIWWAVGVIVAGSIFSVLFERWARS